MGIQGHPSQQSHYPPLLAALETLAELGNAGVGVGTVEQSSAPPPLTSFPHPAFLSLSILRARCRWHLVVRRPLPYPCCLLVSFDPDWPARSEQRQRLRWCRRRRCWEGAKGRNLYNQLGAGWNRRRAWAAAQSERVKDQGQLARTLSNGPGGWCLSYCVCVRARVHMQICGVPVHASLLWVPGQM